MCKSIAVDILLSQKWTVLQGIVIAKRLSCWITYKTDFLLVHDKDKFQGNSMEIPRKNSMELFTKKCNIIFLDTSNIILLDTIKKLLFHTVSYNQFTLW